MTPLFKVKLPTTPEAFDNLIDKLCVKFKLTDKHHAAAIVSVAIRHIPNDQAYTTWKYLGHSVQKNIANHVANFKSDTLKHENQVAQLAGMLEQDPNNQQARDELQKASDAGSLKAKEALDRIDKVVPTQAKILHLTPAESGPTQVMPDEARPT